MVEVPAHLRDAINSTERSIPEDKLDRLRSLISRARDVTAEISDLETRLDEKNSELFNITNTIIPDLMDEVGVPMMELKPKGNLPGVSVKTVPLISAGIAQSWPAEKRAEAFGWLENNGHGDLIKTEITVSMPREKRLDAVQLAQRLKGEGLDVAVKNSVHTATLTKWFKEMLSDHKAKLPPLDLIGGFIGRRAEISLEGETSKPRKRR